MVIIYDDACMQGGLYLLFHCLVNASCFIYLEERCWSDLDGKEDCVASLCTDWRLESTVHASERFFG